MREPFRKRPDPFDNPYCAASGFACDPHDAWRLHLDRRRAPRDWSPFDELWDEAPLPPDYYPQR
jgi:hypothetical protein